jgi:hypothetical protein
VQAFGATLEETRLADLVLHVVDASAEEEERHEMLRPSTTSSRRSARATARGCSCSTRSTGSTRRAAGSSASAIPTRRRSPRSPGRAWTPCAPASRGVPQDAAADGAAAAVLRGCDARRAARRSRASSTARTPRRASASARSSPRPWPSAGAASPCRRCPRRRCSRSRWPRRPPADDAGPAAAHDAA